MEAVTQTDICVAEGNFTELNEVKSFWYELGSYHNTLWHKST